VQYSLSDRVRLDRYAIKDPNRELVPGDLVVVSVLRKSHDGKDRESREVGTVVSQSSHLCCVDVPEQKAEVMTPGVTSTVTPIQGVQRLWSIPRAQLEYIVEHDWPTICRRVAGAMSAVDGQADADEFVARITQNMIAGKFMPAGRILSGLGRTDQHDLTLYNCYVFAIPGDSRAAITQHWGRIFDTYSRGGGVGWDLSILRPKGAIVRKVNGRSSGIVSWAEQFAQITGTVEQGGSRQGACLMGLQAWHPDIFDFVTAKSLREEFTVGGQKISRSKNLLSKANVSVLISNAFMAAVKSNADWDLVFPDIDDPEYDKVWSGDLEAWKALGKKVVVYRTIKARELWNLIIQKVWAAGEPGLLFIDRANEMSNSYYYAKLICTNPCAELWGAENSVCNLGHINLAGFITSNTLPPTAFTWAQAERNFDWPSFCEAVQDGVRFLDNIIDLNKYHDDATRVRQDGERRVGLGVLGYGDMLMRLGLRYGSDDALKFTDSLCACLWRETYKESTCLAGKKGAFPDFDKDKFLQSGFMRQEHLKHVEPHFKMQNLLPADVFKAIELNGMRNVTCNVAAPTGSIATLLETTGGIEPYFDLEYTVTTRIGTTEEQAPIVGLLTKQFGDKANWPEYVVTAQHGITPEQHVRTQATIQKWVDASIAKTVNTPATATVEDVANVYMLLWELGCKGGTVYRDGSRDEQVFYVKEQPEHAVPIAIETTLDAMRPRLEVGIGPTFSVPSPVGSLHITIRHDPVSGDPEDIFITSGKGDIAADVQAMGRLCSLILRLNGVPLSQQSKLELIREQLAGIPGRTQDGLPGQVRVSMPDTIAHVITRYLEGNFPLANVPFGANHVDALCEDFATMPVDTLKKLALYLKNKTATTPDLPEAAPEHTEQETKQQQLDFCPACGTMSYLVIPGKCGTCRHCGYSRCG
jgi:ribonucleoside-diphosphate reductase alpha chain